MSEFCSIPIFGGQKNLNPFATNHPVIEKPGIRYSLIKCVKKHLWKSKILHKDADN